MFDFTNDEIDALTTHDYQPGWIADLREGDAVALPPMWRSDDEEMQCLHILRLRKEDGTYADDDGTVHHNVVVSFIGEDEDGRPQHIDRGHGHNCFFWRPDEIG